MGYHGVKRKMKVHCVCGSGNQIILSCFLRKTWGYRRSVGWGFAGRDKHSGAKRALLYRWMPGGGGVEASMDGSARTQLLGSHCVSPWAANQTAQQSLKCRANPQGLRGQAPSRRHQLYMHLSASSHQAEQ